MINILILNWNSSSDIESSMNEIVSSTYKDFRIILIDNFSKQNDINNLKKIYYIYKEIIEIHLVLNDDNYGYAGGNNRGYEYLIKNNLYGNILVLNPDVRISNNTISELNNALNDDIGGVMARTLNSDSSIMYDYIELNDYYQKWLISEKDVVETDYLAGSCMLLKREIIDKINLFNENFFLYWEEVDLSLRIKSNGYKLISTTKTKMYRKSNSEERTIKSLYYLVRNIFLLKENNFISNYSIFKYLSNELIFVIYKTIKSKEHEYLKYYFKGLKDGLRGKYGKCE